MGTIKMGFLPREFIDFVINSVEFLDILKYYSIVFGNINKKNEVKLIVLFITIIILVVEFL